MPIESWLKNYTKEEIKKGRQKYIDSNAADYLSLPEFMYREYGRRNVGGGVSLQFDEGEVAETMFRGGAGFKGHF
jgi:hypothetical protein